MSKPGAGEGGLRQGQEPGLSTHGWAVRPPATERTLETDRQRGPGTDAGPRAAPHLGKLGWRQLWDLSGELMRQSGVRLSPGAVEFSGRVFC